MSFKHVTLFQVIQLNIFHTDFQLAYSTSKDIFPEKQLVCCAYCEIWTKLLYIIQM